MSFWSCSANGRTDPRGLAVSLAWGGHTNGLIPSRSLEYVGRGLISGEDQYLHPAAAAAWRALVAAVRTRTGRTLLITEGYRTRALQQHYWDTLPFPKAARPGTSSHGWALAVDMGNYTSAELVGVRAVAGDLRWSLATGDEFNEPWHLEFVGSLTSWAADTVTPIPTIEPEESEMKLVKNTEGQEWSLFHPSLAGPSALERGYYVITNATEARDLARIYASGQGSEGMETRAVYIAMQRAARISHTNYLRGLPRAAVAPVAPVAAVARVAAVAPTAPTAGATSAADLGPILDALSALPAGVVAALKAAL